MRVTRLGRWLVPLVALGGGVAWAAFGETNTLALLRATQTSGGETATPQLAVTVAGTTGHADAPPATATASLYPGALAPPADSAGLLGAARLANQLTGLEPVREPLASDFAGNADGRLDVADPVHAVSDLRP